MLELIRKDFEEWAEGRYVLDWCHDNEWYYDWDTHCAFAGFKAAYYIYAKNKDGE